MKSTVPLLLSVAVALAVGSDAQSKAAWQPTIQSIDSPAALGGAQPQLSVSKRGVLLSWVETAAGRSTLKFAERSATGWSPAVIVASGPDWFVNWADVPSVIRLDDGTLAAHWLQKSGPETYAYDVRLSYSKDEGKTWSASFTPHHDGTKTEHGFASLFQLPGAKAGLGLIWLDGRQMKPGHAEGPEAGDMSLRFAAFDRDWKQTADTALDARVCECCPTAAAVTAEGPIVTYRDRADGEVRDTHVTRLVAGKWTAPIPVSKDGWVFPACPVNGPSIAARGRNVAVAYFQAKDGVGKSLLALSRDGGATFGNPVRLDEQGSLGRVDVELLPDGAVAASYIDLTGSRAEFRVRRVHPDGAMSAPVSIASLTNNRSSGYPRMALASNELVFAWVDRDASRGSVVRTAVAPINGVTR
jgi:hypothetical protein